MLNNERGMVGGMWFPDDTSNSFLNLEESVDFAKVLKSSSMLETVIWDPNLRKRITVPICSLPVQHMFGGVGASHRASWYILSAMGKIMNHSNGVLRGLCFDSHGSHGYVRRALHGQISSGGGKAGLDLSDIEFFKDLTFEEVETPLPRFPIAIAKYQGSVVWGLCGVCALSAVTGFCREQDWQPLVVADEIGRIRLIVSSLLRLKWLISSDYISFKFI